MIWLKIQIVLIIDFCLNQVDLKTTVNLELYFQELGVCILEDINNLNIRFGWVYHCKLNSYISIYVSI
jgi:hypothetical protein